MFKYLVFDLETTGTDPRQDHIITCDMRTNDGTEYSWILDAGGEVPDAASALHGMTTEWVRNYGRKDYKEAVAEIITTLRDFTSTDGVLVGYNVSFDFNMLKHAAIRNGLEFLSMPDTLVLDPYIIDKAIDYRKGKRTLTITASHYGIEVDADKAHDSKYDVYLTEQLIRPVLNKAWQHTPVLKSLKERMLIVRTLQPLQRDWKLKQAASLEKYFARIGKTEPDGSPILVDSEFPWEWD